MNNSIFILSNKEIEIERLHLCSWDILNQNACFEIGFEFKPNTYSETISFKIVLPFLSNTDKVVSLSEKLIDPDTNSKFIFNDIIKSSSPVNGDKRYGATIEFGTRNNLTILPIRDLSIKNHILSFKVEKINQENNSYIRIHIQTTKQSLSVIKKGIAKSSYIYDIKINESRNLPDDVFAIQNDGYEICKNIKACFCFHVVPSSFNISYLNANKLKNIRILEAESFNKYLPVKYKIQNNEYIIVFNKSDNSKDGSHTFFFRVRKRNHRKQTNYFSRGGKHNLWSFICHFIN